jgi:hypothetical protein
MTQTEWLTCTDPAPMLQFLRGKVSERKLRLWAVACYRSPLVWLRFRGNKWIKEAVWATEQMADGQGEGSSRLHDFEPATPDAFVAAERSCRRGCVYAAEAGFEGVNLEWADGNTVEQSNRQFSEEMARQCCLLRCIFGNHLRLVALDPHWLSPQVVDLAGKIYENKAFDQMAALADMLMDAGCSDASVLGHCRGPGPHAPGCWILDLLLGKEAAA